MKDLKHVYACLLAGGHGTRFWPVSREEHPKQLLKLFSEKTLIEETYARIKPLLPDERILIATSRLLGSKLREMFPSIPSQNFIEEPVRRNTSACTGLVAKIIQARDKDAVLVLLPSDHYITDQDAFLDVIQSAIHYAGKGKIVTIGITPTIPETGYGYIKFGEYYSEPVQPDIDQSVSKHRARIISCFVEKPDYHAAINYLRTGTYLWNSGIFIFRAGTILENIKTFLPSLYDCLDEIVKLSGEPGNKIQEVYEKAPDISIDYGVMEKSKDILVILASFGWSDVGSWRALSDFPNDEYGNFTFGDVIAIDSQENVLYSSRGLLAVLGLEGIVVVSSGEAVLVCPRERTQDVRKIVELLKEKGETKYI
jgi:mannose-1-phosphate guanylyltransferase